MINQITKDEIEKLSRQHKELRAKNAAAIHNMALTEIQEMVYNSNAIESVFSRN